MQRKFTCCSFLVIKKAFDIIDHSKLLKKLSVYCVKGVALEKIKSCFSNRIHCGKLGDCLSQVEVISFGVPQGSVL